jgi:RNA polymerase sigma-70 factor (sigma-E family)
MLLLRRNGRRDHQDDEFVAYYAARGDELRKTAYVLCGDWHLAEDLTQIAFTRLYRAWARIRPGDPVDQYARRLLLHAFLHERRRPWRRELSTVPDSSTLDVETHEDRGADERLVLRKALLRIPRRQRAVLVLRFWADLSVEQVAEILDCPTGTVKSQTSRGLANLRTALGGALVELHPSVRGGRW